MPPRPSSGYSKGHDTGYDMYNPGNRQGLGETDQYSGTEVSDESGYDIPLRNTSHYASNSAPSRRSRSTSVHPSSSLLSKVTSSPIGAALAILFCCGLIVFLWRSSSSYTSANNAGML